MKTITKKLYEAMFLVDSTIASSDWDAVETKIRNILQRAKTEIVSIRKWDERALAYEIGGQGRGAYVLSYFRSDGKRNSDIERDVQLSEHIMRVLILCTEGRDKEDIEKDTPAMLAEKGKQEDAQATVEESEELRPSADQESPEAVAVDVDSEQPDDEKTEPEQVNEKCEKEGEDEKVSE